MTESYSEIIKFYGNATAEGAQLPFNFNLIFGVKKDSKAKDYVDLIENWFKTVPAERVTNWVVGNHDQSRTATRIGDDKIDILNAMLLMLPGVSVTYYVRLMMELLD